MMNGTKRALLVTALSIPALSAAQDQPRPAQPAFGYSYAEICNICDFTYTKVNRLLAEGRARLRAMPRAAGP